MIFLDSLKYYTLYFFAFINFHAHQIYNNLFEQGKDAVGLSLNYSSNTGGIYRASCLLEGSDSYILQNRTIEKDSHAVMGFNGSDFVKPIPSWINCGWKSGVKHDWSDLESEKYGVRHSIEHNLLDLVPPTVFAEINKNTDPVINKNLELGLDFDGPMLYPHWRIFVWQSTP